MDSPGDPKLSEISQPQKDKYLLYDFAHLKSRKAEHIEVKAGEGR
jgi:hypothetical protein